MSVNRFERPASRSPRSAGVASPAQAQALLAVVARIRPDLTAFFGCLHYGALRPDEATALAAAAGVAVSRQMPSKMASDRRKPKGRR